MPKTHDVVAITGEYEKDGEKKPRYQNVGLLIEKDGKRYLKMNTPIVLHDEGHVVSFFSLFAPRQRQQSEPRGGGSTDAPAPEDYGEDIPFITRGGIW